MGPLQNVLGMLPGVGAQLKDAEVSDDQVRRTEAIIRSMTPAERENPSIINGSRRTRIAKGSGTQVQDVNRLVKQFAEMQRMMKQFGGRLPSR
jgi:signal recognition particle subunit SRP54